jgi:hypothetical protein
MTRIPDRKMMMTTTAIQIVTTMVVLPKVAILF